MAFPSAPAGAPEASYLAALATAGHSLKLHRWPTWGMRVASRRAGAYHAAKRPTTARDTSRGG